MKAYFCNKIDDMSKTAKPWKCSFKVWDMNWKNTSKAITIASIVHT